MGMKSHWWQKAVVYQIYPRSFRDSSGDGIGDLKGITEKLDYLADLGINVIWLCPVFQSPMVDNGYDVSDYYRIDPSFGTNEDMYELLDEANKRNIKVVLDMVVNHCSDQHEWFQKALQDPEGKYAGYFYFRKGVNGNPPNNWRSVFGGSAWDKVPGTDYYYLHTFAKEQVDLNWENQELRREIYEMMNWWLEKGAAGFRMDAITYLKKQDGMPSYPADGEDGLVTSAYGSMNYPGIDEMLTELRDRTWGPGDALAVGEAAGIREGELPKFISLDSGYFSMIFEFAEWTLALKGPNHFWFDELDWTPEDLKKTMFEQHALAGEECWYAVYLENHDQCRCIDHYLPESGRNFYGASMLAVMSLMRRGTPFIYQGQEIGMRNIRLDSIEEYDDCSSMSHYKMALEEGYTKEQAMECVYRYSRDNNRTPFQWDDTENAGFTAGTPWLKVNPNYPKINAAKAVKDPDSLYAWYRRLIDLRLRSEYADTLTYGSFEPAYTETKNLLAYRRRWNGECLTILCNYQDQPQAVNAGEEITQIIGNYGDMQLENGTLMLRPFEAVIVR